MKAMRIENNSGELYGWAVRCPACEADDMGSAHVFMSRKEPGGQGWDFVNGDVNAPTFSPSMLARAKSANLPHEHVCHSFVRDGKIEYLGDCTHALAGQTLELPEWERD